MAAITFVGRIFPTALDVNFSNIPSMDVVPPEVPGLRMRMVMNIAKSVVTVDVEYETPDGKDYLPHLLKYTIDFVRMFADVSAFSTGIPSTVVLDEFKMPDGHHDYLLPHEPGLAELCGSYTIDGIAPPGKLNLFGIISLVKDQPDLFLAFNDLNHALTYPNLIPINCGRVIDGLRKLTTNYASVGKGWEPFREALNIDKAYLSFITEASKDPRHGERKFMTGKITNELMRRTWVIMNRFIEFKKRGDQQLPIDAFPLLSGDTKPTP